MRKYKLKKDGTNYNVRRDVQIKLIHLLKQEVSKASIMGSPIPRSVTYETKWAKHDLYVDYYGVHYFSTIGWDGTLYMTVVE